MDKVEKFKKELDDFRISLKDGDFLIVGRIEKRLIKMYEDLNENKEKSVIRCKYLEYDDKDTWFTFHYGLD